MPDDNRDRCPYCRLPLDGGLCNCEGALAAEERERENSCTCADFDGFIDCPVHR